MLQSELGSDNLIFALQTFNYFEASLLAMDSLCDFPGDQDISQLATKLCAILSAKVSPYSKILLLRFFPQLDTQMFKKMKKYHKIYKSLSVSEHLHTYPSPNPTLT